MLQTLKKKFANMKALIPPGEPCKTSESLEQKMIDTSIDSGARMKGFT
jgi:hypothetical protein